MHHQPGSGSRGRRETAGPVVAAADAGSATAQAADPSPADTSLPLVVVHKTPTCGCCGLWVDHVREAGFPVEVHDMDDLGPVKQRLGIPYGKGSCHTAEVDGYAIEGHVPAQDIISGAAGRPDADRDRARAVALRPAPGP